MRYKVVLGSVLVFALWASGFREISAQDVDHCLNRITLEHPELCLNAQALEMPERCKTDEQPVATPTIDLVPILEPPPSLGSTAQRDDIQAVLSFQANRTKTAIRCAQADACLSIFRFAGDIGPEFTPENLPKTTAFMNNVFAEANKDVAYAKSIFKRPRPFVTDNQVKKIVPQCPDFSYPSGHSTFAYVVATLLANMVPEKAAGIFRRADQYARNRVVAGVHYPSDVEAGKISAAVIVYALMEDAAFRERYKPARLELRSALGLSTSNPQSANQVR
jgi:acid phosphatase (class A)